MKVLRDQVEDSRRRIEMGERPTFHAVTTYDGLAIDVRIRELSIIHIFIADEARVLDAARAIIARALDVDPMAFDVEPGTDGQETTG